MYQPVNCFYLEPLETQKRSARRYAGNADGTPVCPGKFKSFHNGEVFIDIVPIVRGEEGVIELSEQLGPEAPWPVKCDSCEYVFEETDARQTRCDQLYKRSDTGEIVTREDAPPGAIYDAYWYPEDMKNPVDGKHLIAKCPSGVWWAIDGKASNCTMPDDRGPGHHYCWVRHGVPPNLTVDKNGHTCAAGAGSIVAGDYHGFLLNGCFTAG